MVAETLVVVGVGALIFGAYQSKTTHDTHYKSCQWTEAEIEAKERRKARLEAEAKAKDEAEQAEFEGRYARMVDKNKKKPQETKTEETQEK